MRFQPLLTSEIDSGLHPGLRAFHGEIRALQNPMLNIETASAEARVITVSTVSSSPNRNGVRNLDRVSNHRDNHALSSHYISSKKTSGLKESRSSGIEPLKIPWVEHDTCGIAVSPLDSDRAPVYKHWSPFLLFFDSCGFGGPRSHSSNP